MGMLLVIVGGGLWCQNYCYSKMKIKDETSGALMSRDNGYESMKTEQISMAININS